MGNKMRFGRRSLIPSTLEIKTELRAALALDEGRMKHALANNLPVDASWDLIGAHLAKKERLGKVVA